MPSETRGARARVRDVGGGGRYVRLLLNEARPVPEGDRARCSQQRARHGLLPGTCVPPLCPVQREKGRQMSIVETSRPMVGGVDTHLDVHVAAAVDANGGRLGVRSFPTTPAGYHALSSPLTTHRSVDPAHLCDGGYPNLHDRPPSTVRTAPLMNDAAGDARKRTASATSCGSP